MFLMKLSQVVEKGNHDQWLGTTLRNYKWMALTRQNATTVRKNWEVILKTVQDIYSTILSLVSSYISNYTFNADQSRKNLVEMIIIHEYPLSIVEHFGFRKFVGGLQPLFKVPCRNTIKSDILKIYDYERQRTLNLLKKNTSRVAITTDMWTASNQKKDLWQFIYVPCPHTSEALADVLYECLLDWNLDRNLSTLTVDNCTTNDAIINMLLDKLPLSSLMMGGSLFHMRCCAHILNLIVQDGLVVIGEGIEKIRDSVAFWTASPKRIERFEEAARQLEVSSTKKLTLDCKTRWNSTFLMISVAIVYKNVTIMFSCSKYPTANVFFPSICEIRYSLVDWACSPNDVIKEMASKMLRKFDKYWSVIHGVMGMVAVLDPRYKLKFVELLFPVLYGQDRSATETEKLKKLVYNLFQEYESSDSGVRNNNESGSGSGVISSGSSSSHRVEFKKLLSNIASIANQHDDSGLTIELDNYLKEKLLPKDMELDLLLWWKTNGFKYPTLQRIARDILAIPISTVASESTFSIGGRLVTPHRSRLHPKTLEALMCAQSWLLNEIQETCSDETEAYCRTIEYDYDVDEETKGDEILG
ncbi:hypothetical protein OSB04_017028 [Centaurea solstitialis]|uniref:Transposase n=1 Tax=Centaurea solstitialis TaxID=347529 RepID=A0AA38TM62_9ASTR|nr:hypothetical protein OSB04_017028 [Centaurea solstitialis]